MVTSYASGFPVAHARRGTMMIFVVVVIVVVVIIIIITFLLLLLLLILLLQLINLSYENNTQNSV